MDMPSASRSNFKWTRDGCRGCLQRNLLLLLTASAILLGLTVGLSFRALHLTSDQILWVKIWGEIFMRLLKMVILPLVMACIVCGLSNVGSKTGGKIAIGALVYSFSTQVLGIVVGTLFAVSIHPGSKLDDYIPMAQQSPRYADIFGDFLRNLFPDNAVRATLQNVHTVRANKTMDHVGGYYGNETYTTSKEVTSLEYRNGMNTLGVVVFSVFIGIGIHAVGEKAKPLAKFFEALNAVVFKIVGIILWYSPVGLASLIAGALLEIEDLEPALRAMAKFILTVVLGLATYELIILPLIYLTFVRKNPFKFLLGALEAALAGGAASSSAVGLPYLIKASNETWKINPKVSNLCLPLFTQINRDGSVLFMITCISFIAQTYGIGISVLEYFILGLLLTVFSATLVAVPSSSIVVIILIADVINVPVAQRLGFIMAVEWLLDRLRTCVNLTSNSVGVAVIDHVLRKSLSGEIDDTEEVKRADGETERIFIEMDS